ncbi:MAG TPA: pyridoxamine 5'-phosphate oxidase family protein [Cytophagales bacterium]|jgi:nitroimidazol reductase NimA-like FMN-containing flavoprotein (pyridoxamine 5'-phosphate oxidase superfamily)|nr:pyridoxamine 5'-phosphate oxidase family protein [Cytophagales bacterium]
MCDFPKNEDNTVKRNPDRGHYDKPTIYNILDEAMICHIGLIHREKPVVIPTIFARKNDHLYIHGATTSRLLLELQKGLPISLCVTHLDGLVLARSAFDHSMNYRSVVINGKAFLVEDENEKKDALHCISERLIKGRWDEVRPPSEKEMKATTVLRIEIETASAKIRSGPPSDNPEDYQLDIWAGVLPSSLHWGTPEADPKLKKGINQPGSVTAFYKK